MTLKPKESLKYVKKKKELITVFHDDLILMVNQANSTVVTRP